MSSLSTPDATQREGIALPIALAAIVAVGALIAGVFFASTQEYRVGRNTMAAHTAMHAAEVGLNKAVSSWTPSRTMATKVGQTVTIPPDTIDGAALVRVQYTRVSPTMFWVTSTAIAGSTSLQAQALKRLNTLVRVDIPDMKIQGALTLRGNVDASGSATIDGNDVTPAGWPDCVEAGSPSAGLVVGDSAANTNSSGQCGNNDTFTCVTGSPKIVDSTIYADSSTYKDFGGFNYDSLTKLATADKIYIAGGTINQRQAIYTDLTKTVCKRDDVRNWGDTSHVDLDKACDDYYPVVWLKGPTLSWTIANYGGQGILLVDGDAAFNGQFKWSGLIIVQGKADFAGSEMGGAPRVTGGVLVMNRNNLTSTITGTPKIQFSRCALQAVTARLATARQTKYRAWADMSF
jgi:hypothetical protein